MRIGSLFSGYGGLDMAVETVLGATTAWVADNAPGPQKILGHRFPGIPNLGDITRVDWSQVEPVDVITGGSPCQDVSHAGRRAGMTEGTRSNLWVVMRDAIANLKPSFVVWENVRGVYSAEADSDMEFCPGCMGDAGDRGPVLRALGRVLGDLSELGFNTVWHGIRAADVGACHGRFRVFVFAWRREAAPHPSSKGLQRGARGRVQHSELAEGSAGSVALLPTPTAQDANNLGAPSQMERNTLPLNARVLDLLPTPAASQFNDGEDPDQWLARRERVKLTAKNGNGMGMPLPVAVALLPSPRATDGTKGGPNQRGSKGDLMLPSAVQRFGQYADAITRQEHAFGRPAPEPTEPGKNRPRLSARFAEWMMGLPDGWVTDVPGITRNEALTALGNGVVPQQAIAALRWCLAARVQYGIGVAA